ncbi:hypothetical protein DV737_g100, partial [Chaetothyriales sp. CBS 132003]
MFEGLKNVLLTLVPECEYDEVEQTFDVDLLMQQVHNNALDILRLSDWLKSLLTAHCAPVRDTWAEEMSALLCDGARQGDTATLVAGLAKLFELCEAMKLDVSNHQIRNFRTLLIQDGISFQKDYFSTRVQNSELDVASSHEWFARHEQSLLAKTSQIPDGPDVLVEGLAELCTVPGLALPVTLKYDTMRIRQIQEEIQDIVCLGICIGVFEHAVHRFTGIAANLSPMHGILKTRIMDLTDIQVDSEDAATDLWQDSTETISIEITRAARIGAIEQALQNAAALSATSNGRNGGLRIVSIDMGIRNLAYSTLQARVPRAFSASPDTIQISAWQRIEVGNASSGAAFSHPKEPAASAPTNMAKETFEPYEYAKYAYSFIKGIVDEHNPTHVLIERQRFRSGGGAAVQEWTIRVGVFEAMLYATLRTLAEQYYCNCIVIPSKVEHKEDCTRSASTTSTTSPASTTSFTSTTSSTSSSAPVVAPTAPYGVIAARSGSPIHLLPLNAAGFSFHLGGSTASYCPTSVTEQGGVCPPGNVTVLLGTCSLDDEVPGGQQIWATPDGAIGYTQAHSISVPIDSVPCPFSYSKQAGEQFGHLSTSVFGASGLMACPNPNGSWDVFAALQNATVPNGDVSSCLGFDALTVDYISDTAAAWQYV